MSWLSTLGFGVRLFGLMDSSPGGRPLGCVGMLPAASTYVIYVAMYCLVRRFIASVDYFLANSTTVKKCTQGFVHVKNQLIDIDLLVFLWCVVVVIVVVVADPVVARGDNAGREAIRTTQIAVVQEAKRAHK